MRVLRMTTRRWAVAVASLSVVLWASLLAWRIESREQVTRDRVRKALGYGFQEHEARAELARAELFLRKELAEYDKILSRPGLPPSAQADELKWRAREIAGTKEWVERCRNKVAYAARLRSGYEYAAARPWLPVEPDPPEPE
jgi:hypothetical protein